MSNYAKSSTGWVNDELKELADKFAVDILTGVFRTGQIFPTASDFQRDHNLSPDEASSLLVELLDRRLLYIAEGNRLRVAATVLAAKVPPKPHDLGGIGFASLLTVFGQEGRVAQVTPMVVADILERLYRIPTDDALRIAAMPLRERNPWPDEELVQVEPASLPGPNVQAEPGEAQPETDDKITRLQWQVADLTVRLSQLEELMRAHLRSGSHLP